jgi:DNA-binding IclR family transcriptional regulator
MEDILKVLHREKSGLPTSDLASRFGITESTLRTYLSRLAHLGRVKPIRSSKGVV